MCNIYLRPVKFEDSDILLKWANDAATRANSIQTHTITREEHCAWFKKKMEDDACHIYICEKEGIPIGQVRIDMTDKTGEISYVVAPEHRGCGYGKEIIALICTEATEFAKNLFAEVKKENEASKKVFLANDFTCTGEKEGLVFYEKSIC